MKKQKQIGTRCFYLIEYELTAEDAEQPGRVLDVEVRFSTPGPLRL